jgi:hypothetical protein
MKEKKITKEDLEKILADKENSSKLVKESFEIMESFRKMLDLGVEYINLTDEFYHIDVLLHFDKRKNKNQDLWVSSLENIKAFNISTGKIIRIYDDFTLEFYYFDVNTLIHIKSEIHSRIDYLRIV